MSLFLLSWACLAAMPSSCTVCTYVFSPSHVYELCDECSVTSILIAFITWF